ncbi:hypothetical protein BLS_003289 [Venturia inaequalis]|uniref:Uncharacterized protein n=1 Tax=Venturia inaequalis TaxID=5025 RepID=A0A8H3VQN3_VENIN|nr:hypothetical protein EG328_008918 [Venturia inaequalis]KAE9974076.1 hypothetical protein BLS_003289 [Venturia inaequalis]KAE9992241.1 hypothetical protein EG327_009619 [Venturia inaequalis]RDI83514.1 hypothetical protein Vi05172_g6559 [Venturia inaequalis]
MVLGILTSIAAAPAIVGTNEAVMQGQKTNARERHRGLKSNLQVNCSTSSRYASVVNGAGVVLSNNKLYLAVPGVESDDDHPFAGYFLPYPEKAWGRAGEGLVSTISDDPPQLNWIYVDADTYEVKYGNRSESQDHIVGPWDCTKLDRRVTMEGWEGFVAVREGPGNWAIYFDRDDDALEGRFKRSVEVTLSRKEMKKRKDEPNEGR